MKPRHLNCIATALIWLTSIPTWWKMLDIAAANPALRFGLWIMGFLSMILVGILTELSIGGMDAITSKD